MPGDRLMFIKAERRGTDAMGSGEFGASRGSRTHKGIDLCVDAGDYIFSHVKGRVTKIGRPYAPSNNSKKDILKTQLRYVEVEDFTGDKHRFFYVIPFVDVGCDVEKGGILGECSDLNAIWGDTMKNHVHYEVKRGSEYLNPDMFL